MSDIGPGVGKVRNEGRSDLIIAHLADEAGGTSEPGGRSRHVGCTPAPTPRDASGRVGGDVDRSTEFDDDVFHQVAQRHDHTPTVSNARFRNVDRSPVGANGDLG